MSDSDVMEWLRSQENFRRLHDGTDLTPRQLGNDFLRMKPAERANVLNEMDKKLSVADLTINQATKLHAFRRELKRNHEMALRVKR
jgi:hypothetical protein